MSYGKIIDGKLIIAGLKITNEKGGTITRPTDNDYIENGWLQLHYNEKPTYDKDTQKLVEVYTEIEAMIDITYNVVNLTEEEKRDILQNKVWDLEQQYNMCRWQREMILAENSGASDYTKQKANEIETLAKELR